MTLRGLRSTIVSLALCMLGWSVLVVLLVAYD